MQNNNSIYKTISKKHFLFLLDFLTSYPSEISNNSISKTAFKKQYTKQFSFPLNFLTSYPSETTAFPKQYTKQQQQHFQYAVFYISMEMMLFSGG